VNVKDYKLRFILISKTNIKDILEIKYPMLVLIQNRRKELSQILFINVHVLISPIKL
jgi:hypothetical protein